MSEDVGLVSMSWARIALATEVAVNLVEGGILDESKLNDAIPLVAEVLDYCLPKLSTRKSEVPGGLEEKREES